MHVQACAAGVRGALAGHEMDIPIPSLFLEKAISAGLKIPENGGACEAAGAVRGRMRIDDSDW